MTIRPATKDDQELIRELWDRVRGRAWRPGVSARELGGGLVGPRPDRARRRRPDRRGGGRAVGFVFCVLGDPGRKTAHVTDIYVRPDARNKGIGRALLAGILEPARSAGLDHASLEVLIRNSDARRLYERLGFTPMDVFMVAPLGALADQLASDERPASAGSLHVQTDDEAGV